MRQLDRYVFKALTNQIAVEELESYLYQNYIIDKIDSDELIFDLVNINYRKQTWIKDLRNVVYKNFDETNILVHDLYFNCINLIETRNETEIYNIIKHFYNLCNRYNYEHKTLLEFYQFNERWNMVLDQVTNEKLSEIIIDIKDFSRKINDTYKTTKDINELLNLSTNYAYESFYEVKKKDIVDFLVSKQINFESTNKSKSFLRALFNKTEMNGIELDIIKTAKLKIINRLPIFSVVGIPLLIAGYQGIQKGNGGFVYVVFLLGIGLIMSAITDIIQLIWYSKHK